MTGRGCEGASPRVTRIRKAGRKVQLKPMGTSLTDPDLQGIEAKKSLKPSTIGKDDHLAHDFPRNRRGTGEDDRRESPGRPVQTGHTHSGRYTDDSRWSRIGGQMEDRSQEQEA